MCERFDCTCESGMVIMVMIMAVFAERQGEQTPPSQQGWM
jgi:hypothetical protein